MARVAAALLVLAALSAAAAVSHCFKSSSVGGSCEDGEMLCFEADVSYPVVERKVLALLGTVENLEKVQVRIDKVQAFFEAMSGKGPALTKETKLAALNRRREKKQARVANLLKQLAWEDKGVCMNMDLCKQGTFDPTVEGDAFINTFCIREAPAQPPPYVCERMVYMPASIPAIKCSEFFPDNP